MPFGPFSPDPFCAFFRCLPFCSEHPIADWEVALPIPAAFQIRAMWNCSGHYLCIPIMNPCFYFLSFHYCFLLPPPPPIPKPNYPGTYDKMVGWYWLALLWAYIYMYTHIYISLITSPAIIGASLLCNKHSHPGCSSKAAPAYCPRSLSLHQNKEIPVVFINSLYTTPHVKFEQWVWTMYMEMAPWKITRPAL